MQVTTALPLKVTVRHFANHKHVSATLERPKWNIKFQREIVSGKSVSPRWFVY